MVLIHFLFGSVWLAVVLFVFFGGGRSCVQLGQVLFNLARRRSSFVLGQSLGHAGGGKHRRHNARAPSASSATVIVVIVSDISSLAIVLCVFAVVAAVAAIIAFVRP